MISVTPVELTSVLGWGLVFRTDIVVGAKVERIDLGQTRASHRGMRSTGLNLPPTKLKGNRAR